VGPGGHRPGRGAVGEERIRALVTGEEAWDVVDDTKTGTAEYSESAGLWGGTGTVSAGQSVPVVHGAAPTVDTRRRRPSESGAETAVRFERPIE
jgi:hypothetical protein